VLARGLSPFRAGFGAWNIPSYWEVWSGNNDRILHPQSPMDNRKNWALCSGDRLSYSPRHVRAIYSQKPMIRLTGHLLQPGCKRSLSGCLVFLTGSKWLAESATDENLRANKHVLGARGAFKEGEMRLNVCTESATANFRATSRVWLRDRALARLRRTGEVWGRGILDMPKIQERHVVLYTFCCRILYFYQQKSTLFCLFFHGSILPTSSNSSRKFTLKKSYKYSKI